MIRQIRTSKVTRVVACYLALMIFLEITQPLAMYALTGGPSQPEFEAFTPIGTSDMVDLSSGDFSYNIPVMDVGGYPLNLAYTSTATMDQEASWVGLGWDMNVGQISRQMRGLPDDFNGDEMLYENNMKENITVGANLGVFAAAFGIGESALNANIGIGVKYNNYDGLGCSVNGGLGAQIGSNLSVGMQMESSAEEGVTVSPSISFDQKMGGQKSKNTDMTLNAGLSFNSRKGVESTSMSFKVKKEGASKVSFGGVSGRTSFIDASFTPTKRVGMVSSNYMFSLNIEGELWGFEPGVKFSGYRTSQGVKDSEKYKIEKAFGYENTSNAGVSDILDFNREKDRTFTKSTTSLPVTNNTYDLYSIQGQGISGMFRPYKSQVGYVYDNKIQDDSNGGSLGLEFGAAVHWGFDATVTIGNSRTGVWDEGNPARYRFIERNQGNGPDYEKIYFKNIGGFHVDNESTLFEDKLGAYNPIKFNLEGSKFSRSTNPKYAIKYDDKIIKETGVLKRSQRVYRNQTVQKFTKEEVQRYRLKTELSPYAASNHTAEIRITKEGGERYIYGRALYNKVKKEATFDVGENIPDCSNGLVNYLAGSDNSVKNQQTGDRYFNRVTTPAFAHGYLLTSVLSSDYQDLAPEGPSDNDLGSYTKFEYEDKSGGNLYKWRVPFKENHANYDEGLKSDKKDNKGNYQYGEKELLYIKKIITKTHVAIFHVSPRLDAYGVAGENGGFGDNSKMYKLDKISLYSKPEYEAQGDLATPIKEAHFEYDYSLCQGIENHFKRDDVSSKQRGKLTLNRMYFTYKKSNMGRFTPYVFNYGADKPASNPDYSLKAYDVWGNYKPLSVGCNIFEPLSNAEYPYVDQGEQNRGQANEYASVWLLQSVKLPSGGKLHVQYESDDYSHVQDRQAMQMFKVVGAGDKRNFDPNNYNGISKAKLSEDDPYDFLYVKLNENVEQRESQEPGYFEKNYLKGLRGKPVYFRFLLNMAKPGTSDTKYDYVTGYLELDGEPCSLVGEYAIIPIKSVDQGDGANSTREVSPISKAGWYFGRQYLNRVVYDAEAEDDTVNLEDIVKQLVTAVERIGDIFKSGNGKLREQGTAKFFVTDKSWIRLMQPDGRKIGGGSRVRQIRISDQWNVMTDQANYHQYYGQEYQYEKEGKSSGVAAYEPLGSKENPFVEPFYDKTKPSILLAPDSQNYVELPFGECYFPSPKITYSRVTVQNLERIDGNNRVKRHATGRVVTEFYTTKDFPTIVDYTLPSAHYDKSNILASILNIKSKDHLTLTQGFMVHTNDMDGKMKSQRVFAEDQDGAISGVDYKYSEMPNDGSEYNKGRLNNKVNTINAAGQILPRQVGMDYDVVNDFRQNTAITETYGVHFNTAGMMIGIFFVTIPVPLPSYNVYENQISTAVTTKVIHTSGILTETIAYDAGSKVSTKNLAWDAQTGAVLVTETINEYNDNYYSFNFPSYWAYEGMSQAAENASLEWEISGRMGNKYSLKHEPALPLSKYLIDGDELFVNGKNFENKKRNMKAWVVKRNVAEQTFMLIDQDGLLITRDSLAEGKIRVIRSGHRNMQNANMASMSMMKDPLKNALTNLQQHLPKYPFLTTGVNDQANYRVLNASAITYKDKWPAQCECELPKMTYEKGKLVFEYENYDANVRDEIEPEYVKKRSYNPYLYNVLGNWRADKSYAYLTGRNFTANNTSDPVTRKTGFFIHYYPFYKYSDGNWAITDQNYDKWQNASEITQYNAYGQEVENKDALDRYSSAYYGYNNRFPTAVASNTKYTELGYDGFEDYDFSKCDKAGHFDFKEQLNAQNITISDKQAHSGRRSLRLGPGQKAMLKKQVVSCDEAPNDASFEKHKISMLSRTSEEPIVKKNTTVPKTKKVVKTNKIK